MAAGPVASCQQAWAILVNYVVLRAPGACQSIPVFNSIDGQAGSFLRRKTAKIVEMDFRPSNCVLSACQSGIGASGLEYATLARAFAHARVPTVVASYWEVHDDATRQLMEHFYKTLSAQDETDYFLALGEAQREMIRTGGDAAHPAAWSGFSVFGRP